MAKQAVFTLADRLLRGGLGITDGIRLVPVVPHEAESYILHLTSYISHLT